MDGLNGVRAVAGRSEREQDETGGLFTQWRFPLPWAKHAMVLHGSGIGAPWLSGTLGVVFVIPQVFRATEVYEDIY